MQRLQRLAHLLRSAVLVHRVVWLYWVARSSVLLSWRLRNRRTTVVGWVRIVGRHLLLSRRCSMVVLRLRLRLWLLRLLLVVGVSVLLVHWYWRLCLVLAAVAAVLRVLRVRCRMLQGLGRLHHWSWLRGLVLLRILRLVGAIRGHLWVRRRLRGRHLLLVTVAGRVTVAHLLDARAARWRERRVAGAGQ